MGRKRTWTDEQLREAIAQANSWGEVCRALNIANSTGVRRNLRKVATQLQIDFSHLVTETSF